MSICSSERRALDPNYQGPRFSALSGNILLLHFFLFSSSKACNANISIIVNFGYFVKNMNIYNIQQRSLANWASIVVNNTIMKKCTCYCVNNNQ